MNDKESTPQYFRDVKEDIDKKLESISQVSGLIQERNNKPTMQSNNPTNIEKNSNLGTMKADSLQNYRSLIFNLEEEYKDNPSSDHQESMINFLNMELIQLIQSLEQSNQSHEQYSKKTSLNILVESFMGEVTMYEKEREKLEENIQLTNNKLDHVNQSITVIFF